MGLIKQVNLYSLPFIPGKKIIELGGGMNPRFHPNLDIRQGPGVDIVGDLSKNLPLNDSDWEGVFCSYALEHISWRSVNNFLKEVYRILTPGGTAVFITANLLEQAKIITESPYMEDRWVGMVFGDNDYPENTHRCGFSPESIGRILKDIGFESVIVMPLPEWRGDMIIEAKKNSPSRKDSFDKHYFHGGNKSGGYKEDGAYHDYTRNWIVFKNIIKLKPESVLEFGCSKGFILKRLQDAEIRADGLEISKHCMLTRVAENITEWDICNVPWPIPDKNYDLCFSQDVLDCVPEENLPDVIKEIDRTCKRGLHGIDFSKGKNKDWWTTRLPGQILVNKADLEKPEEGTLLIDYIPLYDDKLKINIGSFITMSAYDWVNIDILDLTEYAKNNYYKFYRKDVKEGLPFKDDSVDLIYSSHFVEHLNYKELKAFLKECRRVMKLGSTMRLIMPDLERLINEYLNNNLSIYNEVNDGAEALDFQSGKLWELLFSGHSAVHDLNSIKHIAKEVGFAKVEKKSFRVGHKQILEETLDMLPCLSLYVEIIK